MRAERAAGRAASGGGATVKPVNNRVTARGAESRKPGGARWARVLDDTHATREAEADGRTHAR